MNITKTVAGTSIDDFQEFSEQGPVNSISNSYFERFNRTGLAKEQHVPGINN